MEFVKGFFKVDDKTYLSKSFVINFKDGSWLVYHVDIFNENYCIVGYFGTLKKSMDFVVDEEVKNEEKNIKE